MADKKETDLSKRESELVELLDKFVQQYNSWGYTEDGQLLYDKAMHMLATDHAIYARMPIICKGSFL